MVEKCGLIENKYIEVKVEGKLNLKLPFQEVVYSHK